VRGWTGKLAEWKSPHESGTVLGVLEVAAPHYPRSGTVHLGEPHCCGTHEPKRQPAALWGPQQIRDATMCKDRSVVLTAATG
jgi:hypothetical protein